MNLGSSQYLYLGVFFGNKRPFALIDGKIWHNHVPYKMFCVRWRAIHNRMPTDDKIIDKFKITTIAICFFCFARGMNP